MRKCNDTRKNFFIYRKTSIGRTLNIAVATDYRKVLGYILKGLYFMDMINFCRKENI